MDRRNQFTPAAATAPSGHTPSKLNPRQTVHVPSSNPWTMEERLQRIAVLGQKVGEHINFMGQVLNLQSASTEVKEKAVTAFLERLIIVEKQLGSIHEDLCLE